MHLSPALPNRATLIPLASPSVWEDSGLPRTDEGPRTFTLAFDLEPDPILRYWLRFDGVSYEAIGNLNGVPIGSHRGIWDAFTWDITQALHRGQNWLNVQITKNGGKRFPVPKVLSGFLPYVSCTFGGLWQPVWLFTTGQAWLSELWARGEADGTLTITGHCEGASPIELHLQIEAPDGTVVHRATLTVSGAFEYHMQLEQPAVWHPETPHLYRCRAELWHEGRLSHAVEQTFGFRTLTVEGAILRLNGEPFYPRGLLHWGWYLETHAPNPSRSVAEQELRFLREAGFNMLKACLWVPPEWYLDLCNQLGVAVWLELPLWLPDLDLEGQAQARREYEAILQQVRHHPSILIWTVGCELSTRCPTSLLSELYSLVKQLTQSPMVRDNSGGGECYGGTLIEHADFADYHLYTDAMFARSTFRVFLEGTDRSRPWLQGEFCDHDTMRDFITLRQKVAPNRLWWLECDPEINPQGVRWFYEPPFVEERLRQAGLWEQLPKLVDSSRQELVAHHKLTLETMRALEGTSGYIVTSLKDTPIATAGLLDEQGNPKIDPETYRTFNADTVLLLDWHRRRVWHAGGDRPANPDPFNHFAGQRVYPRLVASHFGRPLRKVQVRWWLEIDPTASASSQRASHRVQEGLLEVPSLSAPRTALGTVELELPPVDRPTLARFHAELYADRQLVARNQWEWGLYPRPMWSQLGQVALYDPSEHLHGLPEQVSQPHQERPESGVLLLATALPHWLTEWTRSGGYAVVALARHERGVTVPMPFWREACHLFLPHPTWERVGGVPSHLSERLFAFSTDFALEPKPILSPEALRTPLWRRVDARTGFVHDYLVEEQWGAGKVLFATLHFAGALGDTPLSLHYHPAGQYWLFHLLGYLQDYRRL